MTREEFIAQVRHMGWCCYQIAAEQPYNEQPTKDQLDSLINGTKYALKNPNMTPEENHELWMKTKIEQGWVYGPVKDMENKIHPDIIPFDELPKIEKDKDIMDCMMVRLANNLYDLLYEKPI